MKLNPTESMSAGVVLERRKIDNPWQDYAWHPVAVIPGAPPVTEWRVLRQGEGWVHYHAGTLEIELYRKETEGYRVNLAQAEPRVFVVLRPDDEDECGHDVIPFLVTVCPFEAQDYDDTDEEMVGGVPMPDEVIAWVRDFIDEHHVDVPFKKRKREPYDPRKGGFARKPGGGGRHG